MKLDEPKGPLEYSSSCSVCMAKVYFLPVAIKLPLATVVTDLSS